MKQLWIAVVTTAAVSTVATSLWWASVDDGKCEFTTSRRVVPEVFMVSEDGITYDTTFTYREP